MNKELSDRRLALSVWLNNCPEFSGLWAVIFYACYVACGNNQNNYNNCKIFHSITP